MVIAVAGWFVSPIIAKIVQICSDYLEDQVRWQKSMKEELQRLQENTPHIEAVVFASSKEQITEQNPALNEWLWQLRDAIDEADDVIDEIEYNKLQKQLIENKKQRKVRSIMKSINKRLIKIAKRALKRDPILKRLLKAVQKLDKVSADVGNFLYLVKDTRQEQHEYQLELYRARETGCLPTNDLIGRGKEKELVLNWLRSPSNQNQTTLYNNISLLSVVGLGGMGKTTLLQHVYNNAISKEFDHRMWVCVSNNFNVKKVITDMLESLKNERPRLESLSELQKSLESEVKSKKFLLVLDDIWEEDQKELGRSEWAKVFAPLASGSMGSKILITTRMDSVALMIADVINKKEEILRLEGLKEVECLQLLDKYAFAKVENPNVHHNLRSITQKIVKKLSGSPLAARVTGGVLNSHLDVRHWKRVLDYDIGSQNDIFSVLKLSYILLPQVLQNCFSYCSIFPQDYEFDKDELVQMWIALGFIQPPYTQGETLTDAGERYFDILVRKSLLDKFQFKDKIYYKLHDLLHELIRSISAREYFSVVDDEELLSKIPITIRHLFVQVKDPRMLKKMGEFKNLRSICLSGLREGIFDDVLIKILKLSRSIRLLYLDCPFTEQLLEKVGHLIHLRYLKFAKNSDALMSTTFLSNLYHLQFLSCDTNSFVLRKFFPRDMNYLPKLHYLKLPYPGMQEIGKLNSLQELHGFYVKNEEGYRIAELEYMNELRKLRIAYLNNVNDVEEACKAKLYDKRNLTNLSLAWGPIYCPGGTKPPHSTVSEKVLDNLQPLNSLKRLELDGYFGARSALWMNNIDLISSLEYIKLESCGWWQTLPPFGQLPLLKFLYLYKMPEAKQFDYSFHGNAKHCVFPSLQVLHIDKLAKLEDWFDARAATENCLFPCLTELYLNCCPILQQLPSLPHKLERLEVNCIRWKGLKWLQGTGNNCSISIEYLPNVISLIGMQEAQPTGNCQLILSELVIKDPSILLTEPLRSITSIKKLIIKENNELVLFPVEVEQWFLQVSSSLCKLEFKDLYPMQSLPSFLTSFSSLEFLLIENVPQLRLLPNIPASLEILELIKLDSLQSLSFSVESLPSLKILRVVKVPQLQLLPNIPASLKILELKKLNSLQSLPSSVESLPSLKVLRVVEVPKLQLLPNFPASLEKLQLAKLESLRRLPSFMSLISLKHLVLKSIPLQKLPDLPPSLCHLYLDKLKNLDCLPSCLRSLSSLQELDIDHVPQLRDLPDLPPSLEYFSAINCHPELKERYKGKITHIPHALIC